MLMSLPSVKYVKSLMKIASYWKLLEAFYDLSSPKLLLTLYLFSLRHFS